MAVYWEKADRLMAQAENLRKQIASVEEEGEDTDDDKDLVADLYRELNAVVAMAQVYVLLHGAP